LEEGDEIQSMEEAQRVLQELLLKEQALEG
jgi:hypothetical protein